MYKYVSLSYVFLVSLFWLVCKATFLKLICTFCYEGSAENCGVGVMSPIGVRWYIQDNHVSSFDLRSC